MSAVPRVSVIIPCRDAERYIDEAIDSALSQDGVDPEVIVIDDASTDGTAERLRLRDGAIRLIRGAGRGPAAARNEGTRLSTGPYVQYLDADDRLRAGALAKRIEALEAAAADAAYGDWQAYVERGGTFEAGAVRRRRIEETHPAPDIAILTGFWVPLAAVLFRGTIVRQTLRWNEDLPIGEDARFLFDAARAGARFVHVPHLGADYRVRAGSLSRKDPGLFARSRLMCVDQAKVSWGAGPKEGNDPERRLALLRSYARLARWSYDVDRAVHARSLEALREMDPAYLPDGSPLFRFLAARIGYERAEAAASALRRLRGSRGKIPSELER